jgi:hypothetical protein
VLSGVVAPTFLSAERDDQWRGARDRPAIAPHGPPRSHPGDISPPTWKACAWPLAWLPDLPTTVARGPGRTRRVRARGHGFSAARPISERRRAARSCLAAGGKGERLADSAGKQGFWTSYAPALVAKLLTRGRRRRTSPFEGLRSRDAAWLEPTVVVELSYGRLMQGWLREPTCRGLATALGTPTVTATTCR